MKIKLSIVFALAFLLTPAFTQTQYLPTGMTIGVVDIMAVVSGYEKAKTIDASLKRKEDEFQKLYSEKQSQLELAIKEAIEKKKSEDEVLDLKYKLESELKPQYEKLLQESDKVSGEILQEILTAAQVVADKQGIDVVLRREVVLAGGIDLTDAVVKHLNESVKKEQK